MELYGSETVALKGSEWLSMKNRTASLVGKTDVSNFRFIADQILSENIVAGRGLFYQSIMKSQSESPESNAVYAAVAAIINSRFPDVGHLLVKIAALRFKAVHKYRRHKADAGIVAVHSGAAESENEYLGLNVLMLLPIAPGWNNIQTAVSFCRRCGSTLRDVVPHKLKEMLSQFRRLLREGASLRC